MSGEGDRRKMEKEGLEGDLDTKMIAREVAVTGGNEQVRFAGVDEDQREEDVEARVWPSVATLPVEQKVRKSSESHKTIDFPIGTCVECQPNSGKAMGIGDPFYKENKLLLPLDPVLNVMKIPISPAMIEDDAKETMMAFATEFIAFVSAQAKDNCLNRLGKKEKKPIGASNKKRKKPTVSGNDVLRALHQLGFEEYDSKLQGVLKICIEGRQKKNAERLAKKKKKEEEEK